jgi:aspartyl-tRNA(Asn)/glutamyl-tRNA(Gln) amidotransferase subunit A
MESIEELSRQITRGRRSVRDLIDECLAEIHRQARLNAFITVVDEEARARAAALDALPAGKRGPLHGIPYAAKDVIATRGIRTTNGSRVTADWVPPHDARVIERLTQAGAVLVGKLNLWEFALSGTSFAGDVLNPWSDDHSPGGSSSGSGAAVAAGLVPFALGTDTGGSIRVPSAWCGITGLRPTHGRISCDGITVNAWTVDTVGPMARGADDVAKVFAVIADRRASSGDSRPPRAMRGLRIGVARRYFFEDMHAGVERALTVALDDLRRLGGELVDVEIPHCELAPDVRTLHLAEAAQYHEQRLRERGDLFGPALRARLEEAREYRATDYIKALRVRTLLQREVSAVFERCDIFVTPTDVNPPPAVSSNTANTGARRNRGNTFLASMTGVPALAVPCGVVEGPPRLPVSLQLHGRPDDEALLFEVAREYQRATRWHLGPANSL